VFQSEIAFVGAHALRIFDDFAPARFSQLMTLRAPFRGAIACLFMWLGSLSLVGAQTTASSSLVISMSVQPSISLEFVNSGNSGEGYCQLTGAGTSTASLNLGIASISGDNQSCVIFSATGSQYSISNWVYLEVTQSNSSSNNYTLTASLGSAPPTGVAWQFAVMPSTLSTSTQTVTSSEPYATQYGMYMTVTVQKTAASGSLNDAINFTATAN
jgi:hypothetical protein